MFYLDCPPLKKKKKSLGQCESTRLVVNILEKVNLEHLKDNAVSQVNSPFSAGEKYKTCRCSSHIWLGEKK